MLAIQGCDADRAAQAASGTAHVVTVAEAQAIYRTYVATSDAAAQQGDPVTGLSDVANAQWEILHAQYKALASSSVPVTRYQYGTPDFIVPALSGYPRWFVAAVPRHRVGVSTTTTTLMVFEQAKSSAVWTLVGATALAQGQQLPAITRDSAGYAIPLATFDQDLLLRPDVVGATQAAVVDDGPASPATTVVAAGASTTGLYSEQSAYGSQQAANGLAYSWLMEGAPFPTFALRLTDGGALVLYGLYLNTTNQHHNLVAGAPIPVPADFTPLLAAPTEVANHAVYANWTYEFAAIDPPATTHNGKLTVIAASGGPSYGHAY
jgi:hypothetical protein